MQWDIDTAHTSIAFAVRHLGIATVRGRFRTFAGSVQLNDDGSLRGATMTIDAASIDSGVDQRDDHLRSADFFDVASHPSITFQSTHVQRARDNRYRVTGNLTMRGATHPVTLDLEVENEVRDPWGNRRVAATARGTLDRTTWGLTWNQLLELGGFAVSEEVKLELEVQAVAPQPAAV